MKKKEDERKKKKEGVLEGCLSFFFSPFLFVYSRFFSSGDIGPNLVVFFVF